MKSFRPVRISLPAAGSLTCRVRFNSSSLWVSKEAHLSFDATNDTPTQPPVSPRGPLPVGVSAEFLVQTRRTPPESPVRMSPVLRKARHWTNFGFSYFWKQGLLRSLLIYEFHSAQQAPGSLVTHHGFCFMLDVLKSMGSPQRFPVSEPERSQSRSRRRCGTFHRWQWCLGQWGGTLQLRPPR